MRAVFITFAALESGAGHLARFRAELPFLTTQCEVSIICLGEHADSIETRNTHRNVRFYHFPASFDGWNIANLPQIIKLISRVVDEVMPNIVVLQIEIWDVMRALGQALRGRVRFATVAHAMPFLGAPLSPPGNFSNDVIAYAGSGIAGYRSEYLLEHYREAADVFKDVAIIANNKTVEYFLKSYFPDLKVWAMVPAMTAADNPRIENSADRTYDFAYMARMEAGKGVEYLTGILRYAAEILGRPLTLAVMGRTDDDASRQSLDNLLRAAKDEGFAKVDFLGWADDKTKQDILNRSGVFIYPSRYDNYPTVVNEALSQGLPVVTWDTPFYRHCYSGTPAVNAVQPFDLRTFAKVALDALNNRSTLSNAAFSFVHSFKTTEEVASADLQLLSDIVHEKS